MSNDMRRRIVMTTVFSLPWALRLLPASWVQEERSRLLEERERVWREREEALVQQAKDLTALARNEAIIAGLKAEIDKSEGNGPGLSEEQRAWFVNAVNEDIQSGAVHWSDKAKEALSRAATVI
jgi:hypothetical protein